MTGRMRDVTRSWHPRAGPAYEEPPASPSGISFSNVRVLFAKPKDETSGPDFNSRVFFVHYTRYVVELVDVTVAKSVPKG